jgi:serine/threonine-protein kinase HipA
VINRLIVLADRKVMAEILRDNRGRLTFRYDEAWRFAPYSYPLSLSMPLIVSEYEHGKIEPWLWGLLPDNETILARWAQRFHVSSRNAFALLSAVGEDCAGAIQLVRPDRIAENLGDNAEQIQWLSEANVAERLRLLQQDQSAWRVAGDNGQFSLAGAQPKTALLFDGQRWGIPSGRTPTTHILKPPVAALDGHAENEHLCLTLAREIGLPTTRSQVLRFEDQIAIVSDRYDRVRINGIVHRLHQEDLCQALGCPPTMKYQNEGGPGPQAMVEVIRTYSSEPQEDAWTLARALMLNWIIGGTDAHSKNFSMLIGQAGRARLAPLYDVASALPYNFDPRKLRLATKVGGNYLLDDIGPRQWRKFGTEMRLSADQVLDTCIAIARELPAALAKVSARIEAEGLRHPIVAKMIDLLSARAERCVRYLTA